MAASRFAHLPVPQNPAADYKKQCVEVPGTKRPGQTGMTLMPARAMPGPLAHVLPPSPQPTIAAVRLLVPAAVRRAIRDGADTRFLQLRTRT